GYRQTNQKTDTGKTLTRWPVFVDHFSRWVTRNMSMGLNQYRLMMKRAYMSVWIMQGLVCDQNIT
ncbi:hypothetical protein PO524_25330, partial [Klebsiella pneumoniae]